MTKVDWQSKSKVQFWLWVVNHNPIHQIGLQSGLSNTLSTTTTNKIYLIIRSQMVIFLLHIIFYSWCKASTLTFTVSTCWRKRVACTRRVGTAPTKTATRRSSCHSQKDFRFVSQFDLPFTSCSKFDAAFSILWTCKHKVFLKQGKNSRISRYFE